MEAKHERYHVNSVCAGLKASEQRPCKRTQHCWSTTPNIVECYMLRPLAHPVAWCCVFFAKFETGQTFDPTTSNISYVPWSPKCSATILDPFAQLFQHYWAHASRLHMVSKFLWVVPFPWCTAGPNIGGSCCIRLHTTRANTDASQTPNTEWLSKLPGVVTASQQYLDPVHTSCFCHAELNCNLVRL